MCVNISRSGKQPLAETELFGSMIIVLSSIPIFVKILPLLKNISNTFYSLTNDWLLFVLVDVAFSFFVSVFVLVG